MTNLKKVLLSSAAVLLPGGLLVATGYILYKKIRGNLNAVQSEISKPSGDEDENETDS